MTLESTQKEIDEVGAKIETMMGWRAYHPRERASTDTEYYALVKRYNALIKQRRAIKRKMMIEKA